MPRIILPLVSPNYTRGFAPGDSAGVKATDDYYDSIRQNGIVVPIADQFSREINLLLEKRPGLSADKTFSAGNKGTYLFLSQNTGLQYAAFTVSGKDKLYLEGGGGVLIGTLSAGKVVHILETANSTLAPGSSVLIVKASGAGGLYYFSQDIDTGTTTFTANTSSGSPTLSSVSSTTGLYSGQNISGTGIPANTRISSVDSATQVTMTANATANGTGVTVTKEHLAKVLDADFPATYSVGPTAEADGFLLCAEYYTNRVYVSDLNSVTSWGASSYFPAPPSLGSLCGLSKIGNKIAVLGSGGIALYENTGNPVGSPFSRINGAQINFGPLGGSAITYPQFVSFRGTLFFQCTTLRSGASGVWMLDGDLAPKKISTPEIDRILVDEYSSSTTMSAFSWFGKTYLYIGNSNATTLYSGFAYCLETQEWSQWKFTTGNVMFGNGNFYTPTCVAVSGTGGKSYAMGAYGNPVFTDDSSAYSLIAQLPRNNFGTNRRKSIQCVRLLCDKQASGTATLEYSDDDFATWTTAGTFDLTVLNPTIRRCGSFVGGRSWRLTHSAATGFRGSALEIDYETGEH